MTGSLQDGFVYLVRTLFDLYLFVLIIRFMLAWAKADYFNPLTQVAVRLTNPIVKPVRKLIPNFRDFEIASLMLIFVINLVKFALIAAMSSTIPTLTGLLIIAFGDMLRLFIQVMTGALLLYVIISWIQPFSPVQRVLHQVVFPLVSPFQRMIPPVAGFDLSIIPVFIVLQLTTIILVNPLIQWGMSLAFA